jgi:hypothetical protein
LKKLILIFLALLTFSSIANASIYNATCVDSSNTIYYNHNSTYNHGWVYINGNYKGDFLTVSSGSGTYVTNVNRNDKVMLLWYNTSQVYGSTDAVCN